MTVPPLGPSVPRRHNGTMRVLGSAVLGVLGWRVEGEVPDLPRFVAIVAPHTSNWDFVVGAAAMFALDLDLAFLGKHTLFRAPLGALMRRMGGIPVDRASSQGVVSSAIEAFRTRERLVLAIAPEGTRKPVERLKRGFLHIAHGAGVPILLATIDGASRCIRLGPVLEPQGDVEADIARIERHHRDVRGWHPKAFPGRA